MATQSNSVSDWINQLFQSIYFHPDDNVAIKAFEEQVNPSFLAGINHTHFSYDQYKALHKQFRGAYALRLVSSSKILEWHDDEKKGGTVGQLNTSINTDKATGKETKSTTLILLRHQLEGTEEGRPHSLEKALTPRSGKSLVRITP